MRARSRYQDAFAPHFDFFGWHWTDSTQAAISILGAIGSVINLCLALPGGYLGDHVRRKPLLFAFAVIATPINLIYLLPVPFAAVIIISVYGSATGALLGMLTKLSDWLFCWQFSQGSVLLKGFPYRYMTVSSRFVP